MLDIKNLKASVEGKKILKGFNLKIKSGEVHAIMGPNGSGKSTLANVLTGKNGYEIEGKILYQGKDLLTLPIEERAQKGLFMAFQYPLEIPGVNTNNFLKTSLNTIRKVRGLNQEEAVGLIVNGFCKEVLQQLPMEFAVEAQKLVGISLEGSVG